MQKAYFHVFIFQSLFMNHLSSKFFRITPPHSYCLQVSIATYSAYSIKEAGKNKVCQYYHYGRMFSLEYDHIVKFLSHAFFLKMTHCQFLSMNSYLFPSSLIIITSLYLFCAVFFLFLLSFHSFSPAEFFRNISSANCVHCRFLSHSCVI